MAYRMEKLRPVAACRPPVLTAYFPSLRRAKLSLWCCCCCVAVVVLLRFCFVARFVACYVVCFGVCFGVRFVIVVAACVFMG